MSLLAKLSKEPQERMREIKELVKREELEKLVRGAESWQDVQSARAVLLELHS